jgi:hypothetical protein
MAFSQGALHISEFGLSGYSVSSGSINPTITAPISGSGFAIFGGPTDASTSAVSALTGSSQIQPAAGSISISAVATGSFDVNHITGLQPAAGSISVSDVIAGFFDANHAASVQPAGLAFFSDITVGNAHLNQISLQAATGSISISDVNTGFPDVNHITALQSAGPVSFNDLTGGGGRLNQIAGLTASPLNGVLYSPPTTASTGLLTNTYYPMATVATLASVSGLAIDTSASDGKTGFGWMSQVTIRNKSPDVSNVNGPVTINYYCNAAY